MINDIRTVDRRGIIDNACLQRDCVGCIFAIAGDNFNFNSGIVNMLKNLLNAFFRRIEKNRKS